MCILRKKFKKIGKNSNKKMFKIQKLMHSKQPYDSFYY